MRKNKPIKICFLSLNSYPLFEKKSKGYFGGAELQISLIVKELIKDKDFDVSLIVGDYGQKNVIEKGRLKIYKSFKNGVHISLSLLLLLITMIKIKADIYVTRTMNPLAGIVVIFCKLFNKKFVYMTAHEWDCKKGFGNYLKGLEKKLFRLGLTQADLVITQTKTQIKNLRINFAKKSQLMLSLAKNPKFKRNFGRKFILWVGRADDWKRPKNFIKLIDQFPKEKFVMICRRGNDVDFFDKTKKLAKNKASLEFFPVVPIEEVIKFFTRAKILINTSLEEGFPNTFLQAGMTRTPVLSLKVNPNKYLRKYECGMVAGNNQEKMTKLLQKMLNNTRELRKMGQNHYQYVKENHSVNNIKIFKQAICGLLNSA